MTDKDRGEPTLQPLEEGEGFEKVGSLNDGAYDIFQATPKLDLHPQIIPLIEKGFGQTYGADLTPEDVEKFLAGGEIYLLSTPHHEVIGVEIVKILEVEGQKIFFTAATVIHPDHQGKRLHTNFKDFIIQRENPDFIAGRTQNPAVYLSYTHGKGSVYPASSNPIPPDIQKIGESLAAALRLDNFEADTFIQRRAYGEGVYGQGTYPQIDSQSHPGLHHLFSKLQVEEGDAFLIVKALKTKE